MDRKSKQKITCLFGMAVVLAAVVLSCFCGIRLKGRIGNRQQQELAAVYPMLTAGLEENFRYYQKKAVIVDLCVLGMVMLWISLFFLLVFFLKRVEQQDYKTAVKREAEAENESLRHSFSDVKEQLVKEQERTKALITDISHQLKIPMASIRMCHELAVSKEVSLEEREGFLETEAAEIQKTEELLEELVKLSRLEYQMIQIVPQRCSFLQTIREAVSQMYCRALNKQIEIECMADTDVILRHDRKWTVEALVNLLDNAVKYSLPHTKIYLRLTELPTHILLEIEDEGIGIRESELHRIFQRFYRGSTAKEFAAEGAGVGLYLTRMILEQQGGTIAAKRKAENGTIFKITLTKL